MDRHVFDASFKRMAIDLSYARGSVKGVADELGIDPGRLSKWRQKYSSPVRPTEGLTAEQKEIKRLQKELKEAQLERDMDPMLTHVCGSKKGGEHLLQGRRAIYGFIKGHQNQFPVEKMCSVLQASANGYYYWLKHPVGVRAGKEQQLVEQIQQVYEQNKCRYGSPGIAMELKEQGVCVSRPRVARMMQKHCIQSIVRKKYRVQTTDSNHTYTVVETFERPVEKWVSDITYIRTGEGWLYLTVVLDLANRKVVGWALSETMEAEATTVAAWQMAVGNRPLFHSLLFHSDRGLLTPAVPSADS